MPGAARWAHKRREAPAVCGTPVAFSALLSSVMEDAALYKVAVASVAVFILSLVSLPTLPLPLRNTLGSGHQAGT